MPAMPSGNLFNPGNMSQLCVRRLLHPRLHRVHKLLSGYIPPRNNLCQLLLRVVFTRRKCNLPAVLQPPRQRDLRRTRRHQLLKLQLRMQQRVFSRRRRRIVFNLPGRILELTGKYRLPAVLQPTPQRHIQRRRIQRVQLPDIVQRRLLPRPQQRLALHPVRPRHKNGRRHMRSLSARRILHSR